MAAWQFQSTPPSRVATCVAARVVMYGNISIHTTLAGGDYFRVTRSSPATISIHTTLAGGDSQRELVGRGIQDFNPHHPRGWRLLYPESAPADWRISIHTTLAGGDSQTTLMSPKARNFNPHHPRGWRPDYTGGDGGTENISIHTTLAGGDCIFTQVFLLAMISIHTTLAGGDSKNGREIHPFSIPIKA